MKGVKKEGKSRPEVPDVVRSLHKNYQGSVGDYPLALFSELILQHLGINSWSHDSAEPIGLTQIRKLAFDVLRRTAKQIVEIERAPGYKELGRLSDLGQDAPHLRRLHDQERRKLVMMLDWFQRSGLVGKYETDIATLLKDEGEGLPIYAETSERVTLVKAPVAGEFNRAPHATQPPYVEVGDSVIPGKVICRIGTAAIAVRASGLINRVRAERRQEVSVGDVLFELKV